MHQLLNQWNVHRRQNQHHVLLDQAERYRYVFVSVCFPLPNRQNQFRSVYSSLWFNCECDWWCVCVWLWILAFLSMYTCESLHVHYFQLWMHCTKNYTNWRRCPNEESVLISEIMCVCLQPLAGQRKSNSKSSIFSWSELH